MKEYKENKFSRLERKYMTHNQLLLVSIPYK